MDVWRAERESDCCDTPTATSDPPTSSSESSRLVGELAISVNGLMVLHYRSQQQQHW